MVFSKKIRLGFEIEGGFDYNIRSGGELNKEFNNLLSSLNFKSHGDGSINTDSYNLELNSGIYDINKKEDLNKIFEDFKKISPYIEEINRTCGIHVHLSFEDLADYYTLLCFDFVDNFFKKFGKKFTNEDEKERLKNSYCRGYTDEKDFKNSVKKSLSCYGKGYRYFAVNFNAFNCYKTIEFRIFPSTNNPEKFKDYINFLYDYVFNYLKENEDDLKIRELIKRKRKFTEKEEDEVIKITGGDIEEDSFKNYVERKQKEKDKREEDEIRLIREENPEDEDEDENPDDYEEDEDNLNDGYGNGGDY